MKNGENIVKPFEKWSREKVEDLFSLKPEENTRELTDWLAVAGAVSPEHQKWIEKLRENLRDSVGAWNETELLVRFIAPLLLLVDFSDKERRINEFSNRWLVLRDPNHPAHGVVDWFVARGRGEPEKPYFFLHEYKRLKQSAADPLGQLLIAMLAAQKQNADGLPVYGAWRMGANWKFVLLNKGVYSESKTWDATDRADLTEIWLVLNKTKQIIYNRVDMLIEAENK